MLELILGVLGSGGFGSIVGLVGGFLNRKIDIENKKLDLADKKDERQFNLDYLEKESQLKIQVTEVEANKEIEVAGYGAMEKSFSFAVPTAKDGVIDKISKLVRPILTTFFFVFSVYIFYQINEAVKAAGLTLEPVQLFKAWIMVIEWALFQAGVCIGWWFAMRPGKVPLSLGR